MNRIVRERWTALLSVTLLSGFAAAAHAQPMPAYLPKSASGIQPAQNVYYGNYQDNRIPGYIYPRNYTPPPVPTSYGGNGITYYFVNSPYGPNYPPTPSPVRTRAPYPAPPNTPPARPPVIPVEDDDGRKPVVQFHRDTNDSCWVRADYVATFLRPMRLASGPLVTTGSALDVSPGALGLPATSVLFGDSIDFGMLSGFRLQFGKFLDRENRYSIELGGFYVIPQTQQVFAARSDEAGNPVISRPINDVVRGTERVFLVANPGNIMGNIAIESRADLAGAELNSRYHTYYRERLHASALLGFRWIRLAERLKIEEQVANVIPGFVSFQGNRIAANEAIMDQDNFRTTNNFFGPQVGGNIAWEHRYFTLEAFAKLAIGPSFQHTNINGYTVLLSPNGNQFANGGILALPSNSGKHNRAVFGILPEFGGNLAIELSQHCRLNLGYSLLLWNHVVRPGSQYDRNVDPTQVPGSPTFANVGGPLAPAYRFSDEFFWTHTLNVGLEIHY